MRNQIVITPVTLMTLSVLFSAMSLTMVEPFLAIFIHDNLNASLGEIGIIVALAAITAFATRIPIALSLKSGRVLQFYVMSYALLIFIPILYSFSSSIQMIVLIRVIHGILEAINWTCGISAVSLISSKERFRGSLLTYTIAISIGLMLGPGLASILISVLGIHATFVMAGIVMIPSLILSMIVYMKNRGLVEDVPRPSMHDVSGLLRTPLVWAAIVPYCMQALLYGVLISYGALLGKNVYGLADNNISALFFGYYALTTITRIGLIRIMNRVPFRLLLVFGMSAGCLGLIVMGTTHEPLVYMIAFVSLGIPHGLIYPTTAVIVARATRKRNRLSANAIHLSCWDGGQIIGPLIGAIIISYLSIGETIVTSAAIPFLSILLLIMVTRKGLLNFSRKS